MVEEVARGMGTSLGFVTLVAMAFEDLDVILAFFEGRGAPSSRPERGGGWYLLSRRVKARGVSSSISFRFLLLFSGLI